MSLCQPQGGGIVTHSNPLSSRSTDQLQHGQGIHTSHLSGAGQHPATLNGSGKVPVRNNKYNPYLLRRDKRNLVEDDGN